jgi:hypothetical protein
MKLPTSFTLRTLFVVVTVICCVLGYEMNWIRQRHAYLAENKWTSEGLVWFEAPHVVRFVTDANGQITIPAPPPPFPLSIIEKRGHINMYVTFDINTLDPPLPDGLFKECMILQSPSEPSRFGDYFATSRYPSHEFNEWLETLKKTTKFKHVQWLFPESKIKIQLLLTEKGRRKHELSKQAR